MSIRRNKSTISLYLTVYTHILALLFGRFLPNVHIYVCIPVFGICKRRRYTEQDALLEEAEVIQQALVYQTGRRNR